MLIVISPAKKLNFDTPCAWDSAEKPLFIDKTNLLAANLKKLTSNKISTLMKLSPSLSNLNYERYQSFKTSYNTDLTKQAVFAFDGDTYTGLAINQFNPKQLKHSIDHLRILSGLYGLLRPHDLIQPYRLEMGTKYKFDKYKDLYDFWSIDVTNQLNQDLTKHEFLVNCASNEYFKVINQKFIQKPIITPEFYDQKNGEYKMISFYAKKARGMMARFIIQNKCESLADIQKFNLEGYKYNPKMSKDEFRPAFTRLE